MIVDLVDGLVWLTISDLNGEDAVVHGVFSSKEYAERCAADVGEKYPKRAVSAGQWKMNEAWVSISDGHLR